MSYEIFTMIIGFMSLAVIMNRNTAFLIEELDKTGKKMNQRLDEIRADANHRLKSVRTEIAESQKDMSELADQI